jgi:hypothetical protein
LTYLSIAPHKPKKKILVRKSTQIHANRQKAGSLRSITISVARSWQVTYWIISVYSRSFADCRGIGMNDPLLEEILAAARRLGLTQAELAARAGIAAESLSRMKQADDLRLSSLRRLAAGVGLRLALLPDDDLAEQVSRQALF